MTDDPSCLHCRLMSELFMPENFAQVKKEREKGRELKKTHWWKNKLHKGICYHCEQSFPAKVLTMDHLVPLIRGGKTGKNNVVTSCKKCNSQKSFKTLVGLKLQNF